MPRRIATKYKIKQAGSYRIHVDLQVKGRFAFDPGECRAIFTIDDREVVNEKYGWADSKRFTYDVDQQFSAGEHILALEVQPLTDPEKKVNSLDLSIAAVRIEGPLEEQFRVPTKNYDRFFTKEIPPTDAAERRAYAREILTRFVRRAFRRPADQATVDRLVNIAETSYSRSGIDSKPESSGPWSQLWLLLASCSALKQTIRSRSTWRILRSTSTR